MTTETLWIVCPSYADVASFTILRQNITGVLATSSLSHLPLRFVLVDDTAGNDPEIASLAGSTDVSVVTPPFNLGHQRALVYGLRVTAPDIGDSDLIVTMDSDGEDKPEDLPRMLAPLIEAPDKHNMLCVARRTERQESFKFQLMYFFFRIMFRTLTGITVRSGNYASYRGWLARRMLLHPSFDICYSSTLVSLDMLVTAVPCARGHRYAGQSRMNMFRLFMHGIRMLVPFTDRIAVRALSAFAAMFSVGVVLSLVVVGIRIFTTAAIPGWATATLLGVLTISFVALGNFLVLFAVFSHSRGMSLAGLEDVAGSAPRTSSLPD
jgi:polyisoprenyl-phosphate glycosyltransferase